MKVLRQENLLLTVDEIPDDMATGEIAEDSVGTRFRIVYLDREANEVGIEPLRKPRNPKYR